MNDLIKVLLPLMFCGLLLGLGYLIHLMTGMVLLYSVGWACVGLIGTCLYFIAVSLALMALAGIRNLPYGK